MLKPPNRWEPTVARALELRRVPRVDRAREPVVRVVRDLERVRIVPGPDDRQHRAEDLLLRDPRGWRDVVEHGRLDDPALRARHASAPEQELPLALPHLDVAADRVHRALARQD